MKTILKGLLTLLLAMGACSLWAKTTVGQSVSGSVMLESGDVFALPAGNWEVIDLPYYTDEYNGFHIVVVKNTNPDAAVPLIVIRQSIAKFRWNKTNCDQPDEGMVPAERYGTKGTDMVTKCARMWQLSSYAQWLQSKYAKDEPWWKVASAKFPDLGKVGYESMAIAEFQVTHFNMRTLQFEAFVRTEQVGISPNTIKGEARQGLFNPIHQALYKWRLATINAADASVFGGKSEAYSALEEVYASYGLTDPLASVQTAETPKEEAPEAAPVSREDQPAYSGRWPDDPPQASIQAQLGWVYRRGETAPQELEHAYELFRRAAEQGDTEGMRGLAWMYLDGLDGVPQNESKGFEWMQKASDRGNTDATADLGHLYQEAVGVAKSDTFAINLYRQSITGASSWGALYLARSYRDRRGVPKDEAEAAYWFTKAADQGLEQARNELAGLSSSSRSAAKARIERESSASPSPVVMTAAVTTPPPAPIAAPTPAKPEPLKALPVYSNRKALVIGNDQYRSVTKLLNARADARALSAELLRLGYQVTTLLDLNERDMKQAVREFKARVEGGDEVLFYYAGHGVQLGNTNYLLPVDIKGENEDQVRDESIQLQRVLDDMQDRRAKFTLAVIDACRDNPFKSAGRAIGGRGLAPTTAATGQMIIFSAGSGQQALDKLNGSDRDPNSIFTRTFIKEMDKPGIPVDRVLRNVRNLVVEMAKSVGHEQVPALYDQVVGDFYFRQ